MSGLHAYRDELAARVELLEQAVAELKLKVEELVGVGESRADGENRNEVKEWRRRDLWRRVYVYHGPVACKWCRYWDRTRSTGGSDFRKPPMMGGPWDRNKVYAPCMAQPGKMETWPPEQFSCPQFYPAEHLWCREARA